MTAIDKGALEAAGEALALSVHPLFGATYNLEAAITAYLAAAPLPAVEPVAWAYELANYIEPTSDGPIYSGWQKRLAWEQANVPDGAVRNVRALYADSGAARVELVALARQTKTDLAAAHAEICKLQGLDPATQSWPAWSSPAHTIAWCDRILSALSPGSGEESK